MDNRVIDITSEGDHDLHTALSLFHPPGNKVEAYRVTEMVQPQCWQGDVKRPTLVLYWHPEDEGGKTRTKLPYPMSLKQAADFALGWLAHAGYGEEPDHDGSNGKGWRLFNESWGHVDNEHTAIVAIQPSWSLYGK